MHCHHASITIVFLRRRRFRVVRTQHVDGTTARKVNRPTPKQRFVGTIPEKALRRPEGVSRHGIHKADQKDGIQEVGFHLGPFGNRPRDDTRDGTRKGKLEEPKRIINIIAHQKEIAVPNKGPPRGVIIATVRKGVTGHPKRLRTKRARRNERESESELVSFYRKR